MIDNSTIGERLSAVMRSTRITAAEVARACGVTVQAVGGWRRTGRIDKRHLAALSQLFSVPLSYWLEPSPPGEGASFSDDVKRVVVRAYGIRAVEGEEGIDPQTETMIPVYDIEVSGGPGAVVPEYTETRYRLPFQIAWLNEWDAKPEDILIARVRGSSMEPILWDGDKVVIHTKRTRVRNDAVYSLIYGGEARVKRLFNLADGSLRIVSDNPDKVRYPDEIIRPEERGQVLIHGQVIDKMGGGGLGL